MDASGWDARYASAELVWSAEPNRWVAEQAADLPPGRALDLAAGEGRNALWLAARGWTVTAVDFSAVALEKGGRLAARRPAAEAARLRWVQADVTTYRPEPAAADLVLVAYLHLVAADRRRVLGHAAAALAPGGILLVIGHDRTNLTAGTGGPQDPAVLFEPDEVVADLADRVDRAELRVVLAERVRRPVETADGVRHAIDALVRFARPS